MNRFWALSCQARLFSTHRCFLDTDEDPNRYHPLYNVVLFKSIIIDPKSSTIVGARINNFLYTPITKLQSDEDDSDLDDSTNLHNVRHHLWFECDSNGIFLPSDRFLGLYILDY